MKIPKGYSESVNRRTDNTKAKRNRTKGLQNATKNKIYIYKYFTWFVFWIPFEQNWWILWEHHLAGKILSKLLLLYLVPTKENWKPVMLMYMYITLLSFLNLHYYGLYTLYLSLFILFRAFHHYKLWVWIPFMSRCT